MNTHELKLDTANWDAVATGKKRAELRINDRKFAAGDMLLFREWEPRILKHTGRSMAAKITHVYEGEHLLEGYAMLSIRLLK
jgi:ASC-1-like (ASCH) protein